MKVLDTPEPSPAQFASEETSVAVCGALYVRGLYSDKHQGCGSRIELSGDDLWVQSTNLNFSLNIGWRCPPV